MGMHEDILEIQDKFKKAIFLDTATDDMIMLLNELAYARHIGNMDRCKLLINSFNKGDYSVSDIMYEKINGLYDASSILESFDDGDIEIDIEYILSSIGYAESSIKKLIKEFKNEDELEGDDYIIAVLETIPSRSKYRKPANVYIQKLKSKEMTI